MLWIYSLRTYLRNIILIGCGHHSSETIDTFKFWMIENKITIFGNFLCPSFKKIPSYKVLYITTEYTCHTSTGAPTLPCKWASKTAWCLKTGAWLSKPPPSTATHCTTRHASQTTLHWSNCPSAWPSPTVSPVLSSRSLSYRSRIIDHEVIDHKVKNHEVLTKILIKNI